MVKPPADRKREQPDWTINHCRFLDCNGSVTVQSLMGPGTMVVLLDVFGEQPVQVPFTEHDDVIEQFAAESAEKPFDIRILPRISVGRSHFFNVAAVQELPDPVAVDAVIVTKQESGLTTEGRGFSKLLNDPFHGGMVRRCEMNHPPTTVFEDDKHVEKRKVECNPSSTSCHTFRATGITAYLENGGTIENAQ